MPMPRPEICVTCDAVEKPGWKMHSMSWRVGGLRRPAAIQPCATALARICVEVEAAAVVGELDRDFVADLAHGQRDLAGLRLAGGLRARARGSMPWSSALRSRCSSGPTSFSSTERSSSTCAAADLEVGALVELLRASARRIRYRRSDRLPNGTVRIENSCCCTSRESRACASSAASASSRFLQQRLLDRRHVVDALGERARELLEARVAVELQRVEALRASRRPATSATGSATRAWISISRTCARSRITLLVSSSRFAFSARSSPSTRARAIATSPASLTSRSMMSARTRSSARCAGLGLRRRRVRRGGRRRASRRERHDGRRPRTADRPARPARPARRRRRRRRVRLGAAAAGSSRRRDPRQLDVDLARAQRVEHEGDVVEIGLERLEQRRRAGARARRRRAGAIPSGA